MADRYAVILAAGKGTRMKSPRAKVLHEVGGRSMLAWSVALSQALGCRRAVVVAGPDASDVQAAAGRLVGADNVCIQHEQKGTADAVRAAEPLLGDIDGDLIVLYADTPLIPVEAGRSAFAEVASGASVCVLGFKAEDPGRYGRLILGEAGELEAIVEANDASPEALQIDFCNSGVMAGPARLMFDLLRDVRNDNAKGEYYLTDIVALARSRGLRASAARCRESDVLGVNSQAELAKAEAVFQTGMRERAMTEGATLRAPETVWFSFDTRLASGTTVEPNVVFGPGVSVGEGALIRSFSHIEGAHVGAGAQVGPFARLRPGADIGADAHVGNFVEVKNVRLGEGAKANHLAYLGDGEVGAGANIGAGVIFCNYDGYFKYRTIVGAGAFVGSNASLVAPVTIAPGAYVGSGSVITDDVSENALALGRGRQAEKAGWAATFRSGQAALRASGRKPDGAL